MTRLIDAEALKEVVKDMRNANPSYGHTCDVVDRAELLDEIDNAPTVETDIEAVAKDAYEHGYTDGWKERFGEPDGRPKGEWSITDETDEFYGRVYRCTHCGEEMLACGCRNFCPNCGADMQKGDTE